MPGIEQRQERHDATFPAVVGTHNEDGIFYRDDHDQRP